MPVNERKAIDFEALYRRLDEADVRLQAELSPERRARLLAERGAVLARPREQERKAGREVLVFSLVGEHYAVPIERVEQVIALNQLTVLPGAARHILGVTVSRSRIVVVLDLRLLLGLQGGGLSDLTQVVVVTANNGSFGIAAEAVEGRRDLAIEIEQAIALDDAITLLGSDRLGLLNLDQLDASSLVAPELGPVEEQ